jgi:Fe-S oxidoreductase
MFDASKCDRCGDCFVRCQYVDYSQEKAIEEITALMEGRDAEILRECVTCMACNEYCQKGAKPYDLILQLQEEKGIVWVPEKTIQWFEMGDAMPNELTEGDPDKPALSLCTMGWDYPPGVTESQMFDGLTVVEGGDYYSKIAYLHSGMESVVRENALRFVNNLARLGKNEIVFIHDDCYTMLTTKAREYGIEVPFKPVHIIEYMLNYLKDHQGSITRLNRRIAYQRPCISRYTPEKEPMLDELFQLIGVERVARRHDREDALCCGALLFYVSRERSMAVRDMNLTDAIAHGAEAMVFLCPHCYWFLSRPCEERGLGSIFITDLCRMALGEIPFSSRPWLRPEKR